MPQNQANSHSQDEGYFASFTDLLVGILFIFIVMLMMFANNMRKQAAVTKEVTEQVTAMINSRDIVLHEIEKSLQALGITVTIDATQGILRLPDSILFDSGKYELNAAGNSALVHLANVLALYLPCITHVDDENLRKKCSSLNLKSTESLEAVLIEGHTDRTGSKSGFDNWTLSVNRAINVFRKLKEAQPILDTKIYAQHIDSTTGNIHKSPVLAVSGYESRRPVVDQDDSHKNRRIDLRFIMRSPTPDDIESMKKSVTQ